MTHGYPRIESISGKLNSGLTKNIEITYNNV